MFESFGAWFLTIISNPLVVGGLSGLLIYLCKSLPLKIFNFIIDSITTNVVIYQDNNYDAFESIETLLHEQKLYYITGRFQLIYKWIQKKIEFACDEQAIYVSKINGCWAIITKHTDEQNKFFRFFYYSIRFLTRNKNKIEDFLKSNYKYQLSLSDTDEYKVHQYINGNWMYFLKKKIDIPLFLSDQQDYVCKRIAYFLNSEQEYLKRNKPYREGIILYGEPGCGKSFFISQLASMFDLNIYYMNLNEFSSESDFLKAILSINQPSILLIEDIDCTKNIGPRKDEDNKKLEEKLENAIKDEKNKNVVKNGLTLSTILNVFDGILSQEGQITIITTNHIEKLDPALVRAGRFDTKLEFKKLKNEDVCNFITKWYDKKDVKIDFDIEINIAELSQICARNISIEDCISSLKEYKNEI